MLFRSGTLQLGRGMPDVTTPTIKPLLRSLAQISRRLDLPGLYYDNVYGVLALREQLLGSDPACLADNAALACQLGSEVIDLNFGCPAKTVNKSRGGAVLLKEPELLHAILLQVRRTVPAHIPVTAKMRLGFDTPDSANECAIAQWLRGGLDGVV